MVDSMGEREGDQAACDQGHRGAHDDRTEKARWPSQVDTQGSGGSVETPDQEEAGRGPVTIGTQGRPNSQRQGEEQGTEGEKPRQQGARGQQPEVVEAIQDSTAQTARPPPSSRDCASFSPNSRTPS
jgi:hypothetical protein